MNHISAEQLVPNFINEVMVMKTDKGRVALEFYDGTIEVNLRVAVINGILWKPFRAFKVPISKEFYHDITNVDNDAFSVIASENYKKLIKILPNVYYMDILKEFFYVEGDLYNFIVQYLNKYALTASLLTALDVLNEPEIIELKQRKFDMTAGTRLAEIQFKQNSDDLNRLLGTKGLLKNNPLQTYYDTGTLRTNQVPQMFLSYGPRSDVDDTMMQHIIQSSAVDGLKSLEDFCTESLSAKKAMYLSKNTIQNSQYFHRKLRLGCSSVGTVYPGSCGNTRTLDLIIPKQHRANYLNKRIVLDSGEIITLNKSNIMNYVNVPIHMLSPLLCRYKYGTCEHCAGWHMEEAIKCLPPLHIGKYAASRLAGKVSQKILSAKHLIATMTIGYKVPLELQVILNMVKDGLYFRFREQKDTERYSLSLSTRELGHISDLKHAECLAPEVFSRIKSMVLRKDGLTITHMDLETERFMLFLSRDMLYHMHKNLESIQQDDDYVTVPLKGFDITKPFLNTIMINDDMIAFTSNVAMFFNKNIGHYTRLQDVITDATNLIYSKSSTNIFFLELVLKSFMADLGDVSSNTHEVDPNNIRMLSLADSILEEGVSMKLSFERIKGYLSDPETSTKVRTSGRHDMYFGL